MEILEGYKDHIPPCFWKTDPSLPNTSQENSQEKNSQETLLTLPKELNEIKFSLEVGTHKIWLKLKEAPKKAKKKNWCKI